MSKRTWTWRHAILESNLPATTRHVLLTIGCYMNDVGGACYPTIETLATATGLSERAVRQHIGIAKEAGWLTVKEHGFRGQKWRNHEYTAAWPEKRTYGPGDPQPPAISAGTSIEQKVEGAEPDAAPSGAKVRNVVPEGAESDDIKVRHHVPLILPVNSSNILPEARERAGRGGSFSKFWDEWPSEHRPDNRDHTRNLFEKLSASDQLIAVGSAGAYRRVCVLRGLMPKMVSFLKDRLFEVFHDAPPIDRDGDFVITPGRPEWQAWLGDVRASFGELGVQSSIRTGRIVRKDRWPVGHETGRRANAEAAE